MVDKIKQQREFIGTFTRLKAFIPSSINETDLKTIQKSSWYLGCSRGFESYDKFLLGLGYEHRFSKKVVGANQPFFKF
jgi:iron complex outermembrane receptor protein